MIVPLVNDIGFETSRKQRRAGARLNSRAAIAVEWTEDGRTLRAEGYTVDVSPKGCLAIVPQGFAVGQRLRLINLINKNVSEAVLIWRGHEGRAGWELGLELRGQPGDFWSIDS
jgi:PilZ domain